MNVNGAPMRSVLLLLFVVVASPLAGCRLFGIEGNACDPNDPATCPANQVCNQNGACVPTGTGEGEGEGQGGEGEGEGQPPGVVAGNETLVHALALADDGTLFWATGTTGGCVRRFADGDAQPSTVHCVDSTSSIAGLAVTGTDVFWVVDAAGPNDRLETLPQSAGATDVPFQVQAAGADVRSIDTAGPSQLAARHVGSETMLAWFPDPTGFERIERVVVGTGGAVLARAQYSGQGGTPGAAVLNDTDLFWCEDGLYARMAIRDNHRTDGDGGFSGYTDDGSNTTFAHGMGWAGAVFGANAFVSTRDASDSGGILKSAGDFDPSFLIVTEVLHQVDPDDVAKYARGIATDGSFVYYTTGGIGFSSSPGVFRVSVAGGTPERIATTDVDGGAVVVDASFVTWTEPDNNRVARIPRP